MTNTTNETTGKIYGYARVSTIQQDLHLQIETIKNWGVSTDNIFFDKLSGKNMDRPQFQEMLDVLEPGDTVVVHKLDRLGRSVSQVTSLVDRFSKEGIYIVVIDAGIDTRKNGSGIEGLMTKALITLLGLMAEMERTFILERTKPAIAEAKKNGVKFGRKEKHHNLYERAIEEYLSPENKKSIPQIIKSYGTDDKGNDLLAQSTFYRKMKAYKKENGL